MPTVTVTEEERSSLRLFHISEDGTIPRFVPRATPHAPQPVVWAIAERHLSAYLVPRECPRISYYATEQTTARDKRCFLGGSRRVLAIQQDWYARLQGATLYLYELPPDSFRLHDPIAGYYVAESPVLPMGISRVDDVVDALLKRDVELRILPSLIPLRDAVVASSLAFSIIRWRNL